MAFKKHNNVYDIGAKMKTTKLHDCLAGYFEVGTEVEVVGVSSRGYDIQDNDGNKIIEIGWVI